MNTRIILKNKYYLYVTEFFAGMSVMAAELASSRLLAPYFSSSQIVWTIIIGTIMTATALGNYWGGRSADRNPDPDVLYRRLLIAALWIAAIPAVGKYVIIAVSGLLVFTVDIHFLTAAALLSCIILFVYPLLLLGTVTPSLARYAMDNVENAGKVVGMLGAFNTTGCILGTFLPTFVTIPAVGTAVTFLLFSAVLLIISLLYFLSRKTGRTVCAAAVLFFIVCSLAGHSDKFAFWDSSVIYEGESLYNYLQVRETGTDVILSTNVMFGVQSILKKGSGLTGMYYDYDLAAPIMAQAAGQHPPRILVLGMGTGTYARQCRTYFPDASVSGVEIDRKITDLSHAYFDLPASVPTATYDGRAFLAADTGMYDVIMVDAYQDITIPFYMSTAEFFHLVKNHLSPSGILVVNMNMHADGSGSINEYLCDTIASVFPYIRTVDVPGMTNRELFAGTSGDPASALRSHLSRLPNSELKQFLTQTNKRLLPYHRGSYLLTDDRAPVEILGMNMIDSLIRSELPSYKQTLRAEGISGFLKELQ